MRSTRKILCLFLALAMFLPLLGGCGNVVLPPNEDAPPEDSSTPPAETENPSQTVNLSGYTLIRPTDCCSELAIAASQFQMALNEATGANVLSKEDFHLKEAEENAGQKEILLGLTNRPESQAALTELGEQFSFSIQVKENKVVILGATAELTVMALDFVVDQYLARTEGDKTLTLPTSYVSHPQSYQEVITGGQLNYKLIFKAEDRLTANFAVVTDLCETLGEMTNSLVVPANDEISSNSQHDLNKKAIVVGVTTYPRSSELITGKGLFSWALSAEGNQIYISAYEAEAMGTACERLIQRLESGALWNNTGTVRICQNTSPEYGSLELWGEPIPDYENGRMQSLQEFAPDYYRLHYNKTTREAYDAYIQKLETAGFSLYASNALDDNVYKTYFKNDLMLHVYYTVGKTSILMAPSNLVERYPTQPTQTSQATGTPSLELMDMNYSAQEDGGTDGMGLVFTMADGSFVVVDGGYATEAEKLYNYMVENSPEDRPLIRAWIVTTLTKDHYGCFNQFAAHYAQDVTLEYFVAQYDTAMIQNGTASVAVNALSASVSKFQNCKTVVPLTGQHMCFGSLEIDFLYTGEAIHTTAIDTKPEEHSLVMRAEFEEQTILIMGDVITEGLNWVTSNYVTALKCDYIQAPHHGAGGNTKLYTAARPTYLVFCTDSSNAQVYWNNVRANLSDVQNVEMYFAADNGYNTLIPAPQIPTLENGTLASSKEFTPGYYRRHYTDCTRETYDAYLQKLVADGYVRYQTNEIGANAYNTYYKDGLMVHAYYLDYNKTVSVLTAAATDAIPYPIAPKSDASVTTPTMMMLDMNYLAQSGGQNNGMGFVYTLEDGSYVIIDGGYAAETDALYSYLAENNRRTDGKIVIRAWIITHTDGDHIGCFNTFANRYATDETIILEYFVAQFDMIHMNGGGSTCQSNARKFSGCKLLVPMAGQVMYFGTLKIEFFFTAEMYQGYTGADLTGGQTNESSLVFKAYLGDTNALFCGDIMGNSINAVTAYYGSALKCQYFQAPHHGLNGTTAFYDAVDCEYLLMTTHSAATEQRLTNSHAHGRQSKLYYLMSLTGMNAETDVFSAGSKDNEAGNELTVIDLTTNSIVQQ